MCPFVRTKQSVILRPHQGGCRPQGLLRCCVGDTKTRSPKGIGIVTRSKLRQAPMDPLGGLGLPSGAVAAAGR